MVKTANLFELVDLIRQILQGGKHIYDKRISYIKIELAVYWAFKWWSYDD